MRKTLRMITMLIFALTVSCGAANETTDYVSPTPSIDTTIDPMGVCEEPIEVDERGQHIDRIVAMWNMWFDEEGASKDDYRRDRFYELATYVVDSVRYYQENEADIGGSLPPDDSIDMLVALIATRESSVDPTVVGKLGEVGLLQVHGQALAGYKPEYVRNNPKLGVQLGVRWLAHQTAGCPGKEETLDDMKRPLSLYAGGPKRAKRDGKCLVFGLAEQRVEKTKLYIAMLQQS